MFNLCLCNAATIRYLVLKFGHMHLCGKGYNYFSPHCCKCNSFGCIVAIRCGYACHGPHSDSIYSGSEHRQFNSPRLVKREAGFPNPGGRWLAQIKYDALMTHHARYLYRGYHYDMHYRILLRQYSQNYYTYNSVVKNIYSPCHTDARVQISIGNTEWLLGYKGVSQTCFSGEKACFHRERWLGETPPGSIKCAAENI